MHRCAPLTRRFVVQHPRASPRQVASALASLRVAPADRTPSPARARGLFPSRRRAPPRFARAASGAAAARSDSPAASSSPMSSASKLASLRATMKSMGVDAFLVPSQDPHFSEYVPTCFERRMFISGFTGSAGTALVTADAALLWTDGRYFLQAEQELGPEWTLMRGGQPGVPEPKAWLGEKMPEGSRVGVDADVHSLSEARALKKLLEQSGVTLLCVDENPVDATWGDLRPAFPTAPLRVHKPEHAGVSVADKIAKIRERLAEQDCDYLVVSPLDEVAWLFNVRGGDLDFNPVALAYGLVGRKTATLYVDEAKLTPEIRAHLAEAEVTAAPYERCVEDVREAAARGAKLWVDPDKVSLALVSAAEDAAAASAGGEGGRPAKKAKRGSPEKKGVAAKAEKGKGGPIKEGVSPIPLAKAIKNEAELEGMFEAHYRDGVAMASFWCWLDKQAALGKTHDEYEIGEVVSSFRAKQPGFSEESFATIAGEGPHGAIIHYRATKESARVVGPDSLLLCDSGGQYDCGTTDVTRTHHTGEPTAFQKEAYTRVLQGHIALSSVVFPADTSGFVLDAFARSHLWAAGLDYRHGTGHGVGAALNVHEGPQSVSPRFGNPTPLQPGMVLSNEPGYYEDGGFGIRIENLLVVREAKTANNFGDKKYMRFEVLTHIPIQKKLVDWSLMSPKDVAWLNEYHAAVWDRVAPRVEDEEVKEWLREATKAVEVKTVVVA